MAALTNIANSSFIDPSLYDISALCDISTLIVNHNVLNNRFKDANFIDDGQQDYCHDAAAIVYQKEANNIYITVNDILNQITFNIDNLKKCSSTFKFIYNNTEYSATDLGKALDLINRTHIKNYNINGENVSLLCIN